MKPETTTMRTQFAPNQISKLPKPTKAQTDEVRSNFKAGVRCEVCGGWHHPKVVHLDYVGHAALTDRLLDVDPGWFWEPVAMNSDGLPAFDQNGGLWIKLTVNSVTRFGYGGADGKSGTDAVKEIIGDALRNAAMRFGAALDLWHKGDLHIDDTAEPVAADPKPREKLAGPHTSFTALQTAIKEFVHELNGCGDWEEMNAFLHCKETLALIEQTKRDKPSWWDGGLDMPEDFVPVRRRIELREAELANHIADIART